MVEDRESLFNAPCVYSMLDRVVAGLKPRIDVNGVCQENLNLNQIAIRAAFYAQGSEASWPLCALLTLRGSEHGKQSTTIKRRPCPKI